MKHLLFMSYNIEIMDLLFIILFLGLLILIAMNNIRKHNLRLEAIEKQLNIPSKK